MTHRTWVRVVLGYLGFFSAQIGFWALLAPRSFHDNFPGLGRTWISVDGPYNEHLTRDVGALNLALLSMIVFAAVTLSVPLIRAVAVACMVWGIPHLVYHLTATDGLSSSDLVGSLGGLALFAGLPIALLVVAAKLSGEETAADVRTPARASGTSDRVSN